MFKWLKSVRKVQYEDRIKELEKEVDELNSDRLNLKTEVGDLKLKKKIEEEDIRHMVKLKEEKLAVENEKLNLERNRAKDKEVAEVKDLYREKLEQQLCKEAERMKEMYGEILKRLPDVNVKLRGKA